MRFLGVDLGEVRTGLAMSDPEGVVATPFQTLEVADAEDWDRVAADLAAVVEREEVDEVVVGLPKTLEGREEKPAQRARAIAARLAERSGRPVHLWDERYTTVEAERTMLEQGAKRRERRAAVDRVAATLLLTSYLDSRRDRES